MNPSLATDFERRALSDPAAIALTHQDGRWWTWSALDAAATDLAAEFRRYARATTRVAVHVANSPELVASLLGCWKAGLVPVAVSGLYGADELRSCVEEVAPALVVTALPPDGAGPPVLPLVAVAEVLDRHQGEAYLDRAFTPSPQPSVDDEGIVLFTGGTTGAPKPVSLTHVGTYQSMANLVRAQKGRPGPFDTCPPSVPPNLLALPLFHSGGLQSMLVAVHLGRSMLLMERFAVDRVAELVPRHGVDNLFLLPTMIYDLTRAEPAPDLSSVRRVLVAGQRLDPSLQAEFERRFQVMVLSNYGSTELGHVAGWTGPDLKEGRWRPGAVGRVYDGVTVEIRDEDGEPVPPGEVGELWVRSRRTRGYVAAEETSAGDLLVDGWIRSGDMARLEEDGLLFLVGRRRELIKTGGFQVWPAELEQVVRAHPGVDDVAVVGQQDDRLGEIPVAVVVPAGDVGDIAEWGRSVIEHCRDRVAHFKAVRAVYVIEALPRSEAGKVQRDQVQRTLPDLVIAAAP